LYVKVRKIFIRIKNTFEVREWVKNIYYIKHNCEIEKLCKTFKRVLKAIVSFLLRYYA
jgi:hypothetical protein